MLGGAAVGGLVAAAAAGLAVTGTDWLVDPTVDDGAVDDGAGPALADPQPAAAMSATVTGKLLFMS